MDWFTLPSYFYRSGVDFLSGDVVLVVVVVVVVEVVVVVVVV